MIIPTQLPVSGGGELTILKGRNSSESEKYICVWQDNDLVLVYRDQIDQVIEALKNFKEAA